MKKTWTCYGGGFVKLQECLCGDRETKCEICAALLKECGFDKERLEHWILKSLSGEANLPQEGESKDAEDLADRPAQDAEASADGNGAAASEPNGSAASGGNQDEDDDKADKEQSSRDPFAWARSLAPDIVLLPAGTFNKKFPYQCKICATRRQPEGKVGDLCRAHSQTIKHFLQTHISSHTRQKNLQQFRPVEAPKRLQDCQA